MQNLSLSPLLSEVIRFSGMLDLVVFKHIYRERNSVANGLAEDGSMVQEGAWLIMKQWNTEYSEICYPFDGLVSMIQSFEELNFDMNFSSVLV